MNPNAALEDSGFVGGGKGTGGTSAFAKHRRLSRQDETKTVSSRETERNVLKYVGTVSQQDDGLQAVFTAQWDLHS